MKIGGRYFSLGFVSRARYQQAVDRFEHTLGVADDMAKVRASELRKAQEEIQKRDREIYDLKKTLAQFRMDYHKAIGQIEDLEGKLVALQAEHDDVKADLQAMRSLPLWTRTGKSWTRVYPGESPITPSDPIITAISQHTAIALANELYARASTDLTLRTIINRAGPISPPEPSGDQPTCP